MAETENKYVKRISDEAKQKIIDESVQNLSARPTSNATEMKKRFVMPIVNDEDKPSLADQVDRVADEAEAALEGIHGELAVKELQIQVVNSKADNNAADIKTLQGNVTELSENDADQKTRLEVLVAQSKVHTENIEILSGVAYGNSAAIQAASEKISGAEYNINYGLGSRLKLTVNNKTFEVEAQLIAKSGKILSTQTIDLPLESVVIGGYYDDEDKTVALKLQHGGVVTFPIGDLVDGLLSSSEKGQPNGVASLDENGKVTAEQLPEGIGGGLPEGFNPEDYVKFTDYATGNKAGVVKPTASNGINVGGGGVIYIVAASNTEIDEKKTSYKPISPSNHDYAVKVGITTNTETLTDEEKASACDWLGAVQRSQPASGIRLYGSNNVKQTTYDLNQDGAVVLENNSLKTVPLSDIGGGGTKLYRHKMRVALLLEGEPIGEQDIVVQSTLPELMEESGENIDWVRILKEGEAYRFVGIPLFKGDGFHDDFYYLVDGIIDWGVPDEPLYVLLASFGPDDAIFEIVDIISYEVEDI